MSSDPIHNEAFLPVSTLRQWFAYDGSTGKVTRKLTRRNHDKDLEFLGSVKPTGHWTVNIGLNNKEHTFQLSRIAWALHYGEWPSMPVTFRDADKNNLRIDNLRLGSISDCLRASKPYEKASQLPRGVTRNKNRYVARITIHPGKGAKHIGRFDTPLEASAAYEAMAKKHFGEFRRPQSLAQRMKQQGFVRHSTKQPLPSDE